MVTRLGAWRASAGVRGRVAAVSALFGMACSYDVPEHHVVVTSDCSGALQSGRFRFEATDFETSCSGKPLSGGCHTNVVEGRKVSGDLEPRSFFLTGLEEGGPQRYELMMDHPEPEGDASEAGTPNGLPPQYLIWCGWYVNEDLEPVEGSYTSCYYSANDCSADLRVEL